MQQCSGPTMHYTSQPSSSRQLASPPNVHCAAQTLEDIMDNIDTEGEYVGASCENLTVGNWDDVDDDTDDKSHIEQKDDAGDVHGDLMIVLS